jgi:hypothetical protein
MKKLAHIFAAMALGDPAKDPIMAQARELYNAEKQRRGTIKSKQQEQDIEQAGATADLDRRAADWKRYNKKGKDESMDKYNQRAYEAVRDVANKDAMKTQANLGTSGAKEVAAFQAGLDEKKSI